MVAEGGVPVLGDPRRQIFAEIGEIFAGTKAVPEGATIIYDSVGIAIMDTAAAKLAYDLSRQHRA